MNEKDFVNEISKRTEISKDAIKAIFNVSQKIILEKLLCNEEVEMPQLGKFTTFTKKQRIGVNLINNHNKLLDTCIYPSFKICHAIKSNFKKNYQKNF